MDTRDTPNATAVRRKILSASVCALLSEVGFDASDRDALETLVEMEQALISEIARSAKNYCELAGRVETTGSDLLMALGDLGLDMVGIEQYARRPQRIILPSPQPWQPVKQPPLLQSGQKQPLPSYVPSNCPAFPHPHAYVRTPTHKQPVTEYEAIREKSASQKRDMEKALTRFIARTGQTNNLFKTEDANIFPLIATKKTANPYLASLLPQDQIFDPEELEYDPRDDLNRQMGAGASHKKEDVTDDEEKIKEEMEIQGHGKGSRKRKKEALLRALAAKEDANKETHKKASIQTGNTNETIASVNSTPVISPIKPVVDADIDNPYLRAAKNPKKRAPAKVNALNNIYAARLEM